MNNEWLRNRYRERRAFVEAHFDALLRAELIRPAPSDEEGLRRFLGAAESRTAALASEEAGCLSKTAWLWHLRRLPEMLFESQTGGGYTREVAEILTGTGGTEASAHTAGPDYPLDPSTIDRVLTLVARAQYVANISWLILCDRRGIALRWRHGSELPRAVLSRDDERAMSLYLSRLSGSGNRFMASPGTDLFQRNHHTGGPSLLVAYSRIPRSSFRDTVWKDGCEHAVRVPASFYPVPVDTAKIKSFAYCMTNAGIAWPSNSCGALMLFLKLFTEMGLRLDAPWLSAADLGYLSVSFDYLPELVRRQWRECRWSVMDCLPGHAVPETPEVLRDTLAESAPSLRPFRPGPLIRRDGDIALVDLSAITYAFDESLSFPEVDGSAANVRAELFERDIQEMIDQTPCRPRPEVRRLVGKRLRLGRCDLTDLDAAAEVHGTLLVVSGKSLLLTAGFRRSDYQAMRSVSSRIIEACTQAADIALTLEANPKGDNYDVTAFAKILCVVCVPFVSFVPLGSATAEIAAGLRAHVTLSELKAYLNGLK